MPFILRSEYAVFALLHTRWPHPSFRGCSKVEAMEQGRYLRDIIHCCEFLQNHIRHFYQYTVPDFVKINKISLFCPTMMISDYQKA